MRLRSRREIDGEISRPGQEGRCGEAAQVARYVLELLEREREKPAGGNGSPSAEMDARRGDLNQALDVSAVGAGRPHPDGLPLLVRLEVPPFREGSESSGEVVEVGHGEVAQVRGSAARISSISGTSTYPSTRFTTLPDPSTKRTVG